MGLKIRRRTLCRCTSSGETPKSANPLAANSSAAWVNPADLKVVDTGITSAEDLFDFLAERIIQRLPADKQNQARADWWKCRDS
jgi:uncharacterized protein (UPF0264 family)